ncbi:MAG: phosphate ABC transporter permease PstA [Actinobacteria bacterium]|nr:phosphate ABC transporter permease PstA [Actinomycetota bacterium]
MSSVIATPKPGKPWTATPQQRLITASIYLGAALVSFTVVAITPMKGKLAYFVVFFFSSLLIDFILSYIQRGMASAKDAIARGFVSVGMTLAVLPIFSILFEVVKRGYKGLNLNLFTKDMSLTSVNDPIGNGGLIHAITGTIIMVAIALIVAMPIGILTAIYLTEIRGKFAAPIKFLVQAMSGVPSIVAGLFILSAYVYPITGALSGFAGSLALMILMIPTIARTSEEVLLLIPNDLREAGVALGGTQWRTVALVVVPAAKSGLVTALILGIARVAGETAPLVLLTGGGEKVNLNPFDGPMGSLPIYIWKCFGQGTEESIARAWSGILVLLVIVLALFTAARFLSERKVTK